MTADIVIAHADGTITREPWVWTGKRADAATALKRQTLEANRELCARHGEYANNVSWVEYDVIDLPLLRFGIYLVDDDGGPQLEPDGETIAMTTREHPLVGALPEWWRP